MMRLYRPDGTEQLLTHNGVKLRDHDWLAGCYQQVECDTIEVVPVLYCGRPGQLVLDENGKIVGKPRNAAATVVMQTAAFQRETARRFMRSEGYGERDA